MKNVAKWVEIPTKDLDRAKAFYSNLFQLELTDMEFPNGLKMSVMMGEPDGVGCALCHFPEFYKPATIGTLVYLNADSGMDDILSRVTDNGGKIETPRTQISPENGYMAIISDTEGNRIGLHSDS